MLPCPHPRAPLPPDLPAVCARGWVYNRGSLILLCDGAPVRAVPRLEAGRASCGLEKPMASRILGGQAWLGVPGGHLGMRPWPEGLGWGGRVPRTEGGSHCRQVARGGDSAAQLCLALTTPWTVCSPPGSMGFSRQEHWSGCHFLLQGIFPTQGLNPGLLYRQADPLPTGASHEFTPSPLPQPPAWATSWKGGRLWVVGGQQRAWAG